MSDHPHWTGDARKDEPACAGKCAWCGDCHTNSCVCNCNVFGPGEPRPGDWCCIAVVDKVSRKRCKGINPSSSDRRRYPVVDECGKCEMERIKKTDFSKLYGKGRDVPFPNPPLRCESDIPKTLCRRSEVCSPFHNRFWFYTHTINTNECAELGSFEAIRTVSCSAIIGYCGGGELAHPIPAR